MFWSESGEKSASDQAAFTRQNSSKLICGWILMWETTGDALFHRRKSYYGLWTRILVKSVLMMDLFLTSLLKTLTDGLEWCRWLWCFYQTLILTAPIHCRASIAETLMQRHISPNLMKKQTHPDLRWPEDEHISVLVWTIPLTHIREPCECVVQLLKYYLKISGILQVYFSSKAMVTLYNTVTLICINSCLTNAQIIMS